jgi:YkoY family integral membrane protein
MTELIIFLNIILLEIVLSIDNAAVLATMVKQLPQHQQKKSLTYGIVGAYLFRGLALLFASILINVTWLKVVGGLYLIYLAYSSLFKEQNNVNVKPIRLPWLNVFWSTVVMIEIMDLIFSIDNVFASVAFTNNIWIIFGGVFIGILAMRFATTKFIKVMERVPILEKVAYWVIFVLGVRLVISYWLKDTNTEFIDITFSILTLISFLTPILLKKK